MVTRARDPGPLAREVEHTADVGFEVAAPTLAVLFERAGLALLAVMADLGSVEPRERIEVVVEGETLEELLHDFLQALLLRFQVAGFVACELAVDVITGRSVHATAAGEPVDPRRHGLRAEVKAVTWHQLAVRERPGGWWARVIVDV
jgi:SHS2 domain-containing protein